MEEIKNKDIMTYLSFSNHNNVILDEYYEKKYPRYILIQFDFIDNYLI